MSLVARSCFAWLACLALSQLACTEAVQKPKPPDTRALLASYRAPSGLFTAETAPAVRRALDDKVSGLSTLCGFTEATDLVCEEVGETCGGCAGLSPLFDLFNVLRTEDSEDQDVGSALQDQVEGDGYIRIRRICPGHGEPSPDEAHGRIELVINVSEQGFDSVVFGEAVACQLQVLGVAQTIDADLSITFGESWGFDGLDALRPVVALAGSITLAEEVLPLNADLELGLGQAASLALALDAGADGSFVFFNDAEGSGFRAKNGLFFCDFREGQCDDDGRSISLR